MDDLLKEAIADAKAVRETALANAKIALEEAFTPRLTSMLSQKIQHEVEGDEVEDAEETYEEDEEAPVEPEVEAPAEDEEEPVVPAEEDEEAPVEPEAEEAPEEMMDAEEGEEEMEEEEDDVVEINGVKYAPVVSEEEDEEEVEEGEGHEDAEEADELDLEAILRELEDAEEDEEEPVAEGEEEDEEEPVAEGEEEEEVEESVTEGDEEDDDVDLEEVLKALSEEEEGEEEVEEVAKLQTELKEHRDVVKFLRAKLNEVNLLNAKLLFSNKLFRTFGLTNEQKMKVVETFDRTKNLREIKLVYSTLAESFGQVKASPIKESVRKGSSSKAVASTKPKKKVISEGDDLKARFKKLANII